MPSGYTAPVADGTMTDLTRFVLQCARAFGATIMQRDQPLDEPPAFRTVSSYYAENIAREEKHLAKVLAMTDEECRLAAIEQWQRTSTEKAESKKNNETIRKRYLDMIQKVEAWTPPSDQHTRLKEFMLEQLNSGLSFDVMSDDYFTAPPVMTSSEWKQQQIDLLEWNLTYSKRNMKEEQKRVDEANEWIALLYKALT